MPPNAVDGSVPKTATGDDQACRNTTPETIAVPVTNAADSGAPKPSAENNNDFTDAAGLGFYTLSPLNYFSHFDVGNGLDLNEDSLSWK